MELTAEKEGKAGVQQRWKKSREGKDRCYLSEQHVARGSAASLDGLEVKASLNL